MLQGPERGMREALTKNRYHEAGSSVTPLATDARVPSVATGFAVSSPSRMPPVKAASGNFWNPVLISLHRGDRTPQGDASEVCWRASINNRLHYLRAPCHSFDKSFPEPNHDLRRLGQNRTNRVSPPAHPCASRRFPDIRPRPACSRVNDNSRAFKVAGSHTFGASMPGVENSRPRKARSARSISTPFTMIVEQVQQTLQGHTEPPAVQMCNRRPNLPWPVLVTLDTTAAM